MILVWQYGSNMDEERINSPTRLGGKAKFVQIAIKRGYKLSFTHTNKEGFGTADIEVDPTSYVIGCLYEIPDNKLEKLDRVEGVKSGAYKRDKITISRLNHKLEESCEPISAITYVVVSKEENPKTNAEYANYILRGINTHKMGRPYFEKVRKTIIENNPRVEKELLNYA